MPFLNADWGTSLFLDRDPKIIGPRRVVTGVLADSFILPVTWTIKRLLQSELLVTWEIVGSPLLFANLLVTWASLQQATPLGVTWIVLPGDPGWAMPQPSGTPAPVETAFADGIQKPAATSGAP